MPSREDVVDGHTPVSHHVFHLLLSLVDRPRHGYGILLDVESRTGGSVTLGTGTLYSAIKRLHERGWVEETEPPGDSDDDPRRKYYRLTSVGRAVVVSEAKRLEEMVRQARAAALLPREATS